VNLLLVGCGKMGGALLKGWARHAGAYAIAIVDPVHSLSNVPKETGVLWFKSPDDLPNSYSPTATVIAVKPQHMDTVLPIYARYGESVFLSIAAGRTLNSLAALLGNGKHAIVRAMPNLPASIGMGITAAVANENVAPSQHKLCDSLLQGAGDVVWLENEKMIDAVTALSGCGPAYLFALTETMAAAGAKLGLPSETAMRLARQTIAGSGALLAQSLESPAALRQAVASPGGTTEAALKILLAEDGLPGLMLRAMEAAAARAKELAS